MVAAPPTEPTAPGAAHAAPQPALPSSGPQGQGASPGGEPRVAGPVVSKTLATWLALLGGPLGLHRLYLHGPRDLWAWLHPIPSALGAWGLWRVRTYGQDDQLSWVLIPLLGFITAFTMLQAILIGLTPDERWHAERNPGHADPARLPQSGWAAVMAVILALMVGAGVLMATIAFSAQRYFEYQVEEARKISQ